MNLSICTYKKGLYIHSLKHCLKNCYTYMIFSRDPCAVTRIWHHITRYSLWVFRHGFWLLYCSKYHHRVVWRCFPWRRFYGDLDRDDFIPAVFSCTLSNFPPTHLLYLTVLFKDRPVTSCISLFHPNCKWGFFGESWVILFLAGFHEFIMMNKLEPF